MSAPINFILARDWRGEGCANQRLLPSEDGDWRKGAPMPLRYGAGSYIPIFRTKREGNPGEWRGGRVEEKEDAHAAGDLQHHTQDNLKNATGQRPPPRAAAAPSAGRGVRGSPWRQGGGVPATKKAHRFT